MAETENTFARRLALLRREKGYSQKSVAEKLGISQALLSHYEKGIREPGLPFLARTCRLYGVSADYLLGLREREETPARDRAVEKVCALLREEELMPAVEAALYDLLCAAGAAEGSCDAAAVRAAAELETAKRLSAGTALPEKITALRETSPAEGEALRELLGDVEARTLQYLK